MRFSFILMIWMEFSGMPVRSRQAFHASASSMIVFRTEDMVETSAPCGTIGKRGTLRLTLSCSRSQQTSVTKARYSSSRSDWFPPVEITENDFLMISNKRVALFLEASCTKFEERYNVRRPDDGSEAREAAVLEPRMFEIQWSIVESLVSSFRRLEISSAV